MEPEELPNRKRQWSRARVINQDCAICLDKLMVSGAKPMAASLWPCGHLFHQECIISWTRRNKSCPLCRQDLTRIYLEKIVLDKSAKTDDNKDNNVCDEIV